MLYSILIHLFNNEAHDIHDYQQHKDTSVSKSRYIKLYRSTTIYSSDFVYICQVFRILDVASSFWKIGEHVEKTKKCSHTFHLRASSLASLRWLSDNTCSGENARGTLSIETG